MTAVFRLILGRAGMDWACMIREEAEYRCANGVGLLGHRRNTHQAEPSTRIRPPPRVVIVATLDLP